MVNVGILGKGGREQAFTWKIAQSELVNKVYCLSGNGGTAAIKNAENITGVGELDFNAILKEIRHHRIDHVIIGPEAPLEKGIVEFLDEEGIICSAPTKAASKLEWSKLFAKDVMAEVGIPIARYKATNSITCITDYISETVDSCGGVVIKDDALAAGKGVTVCRITDFPKSYGDAQRKEATIIEAYKAIEDITKKKHVVLAEEMLVGPEFSFIGVTDGKTFLPLLPSEDYKRVFDHDKGPNTGSMGSLTPTPIVTDEINTQMCIYAERLIAKMKRRGTAYKGIIYFGCIKTSDGVKVLEINARGGDPETQSTLPLLEGDLYKILHASATEQLDKVESEFEWRHGAACCVVLASGGYPGEYKKGYVINGLEKLVDRKDALVFCAGVQRLGDGTVVTDGGRVVDIVGIGPNTKAAVKNAYSALKGVRFGHMHYRTDIGHRALDMV